MHVCFSAHKIIMSTLHFYANSYHHTPPINTLFGLREALSILAKEVGIMLLHSS